MPERGRFIALPELTYDYDTFIGEVAMIWKDASKLCHITKDYEASEKKTDLKAVWLKLWQLIIALNLYIRALKSKR